jgi:hypothetical protein
MTSRCGRTNRAQAGEVVADVEQFVDELLVRRVLREHVILDVLELGAEFFDDGRVIIDEEVDQGVRDAVRSARSDAGALREPLDQRGDGTQRCGTKRDEVVLAQKQIELGGVELVGAREIDGVRDNEQVVLVVLDLGQRIRRDAVLDRERVKLEDAFEDIFDLLGRGAVHIHPKQEPLVGADEPERLELEILPNQLAVAEDEGANHAAGQRGERLRRRRVTSEPQPPRGDSIADCGFRIADWRTTIRGFLIRNPQSEIAIVTVRVLSRLRRWRR